MNKCIIPARGGSKRIPKKNIKNFKGKPMIVWSIETAQKSECFDSIIVSTDDKDIAKIAKDHGAEVPFLRPKNLSDDFTSTVEVIAHSLKNLIQIDKSLRYVCCLYATSPFVTPEDLIKGRDLIKNSKADYAISITEYSHPAQRALHISDNNRIKMHNPKLINYRTQDLEPTYHDAGQFYWGSVSAWINQKSLLGNNSIPIILPRYRAIDIDTQDDWKLAEYIFDYQNKE